MKKTAAVLLISFLVLLSVNLDAQWVKQNSGTTYFLQSVFSTNSNTAYAAGYYNAPPYGGLVIKTSDGGSTWNPLIVTSVGPMSVYFTDTNTGYIAADDTILKTTDAGASWSKYPINMAIYMTAVYFYNSTIGYAGGLDFSGSLWYIFTTTDGGATWAPHAIPSSRTRPTSFFATSANTCYFAGGVALKTTNAGTTWDTTLSPGFKDWYSVNFTSTTNGVIVGGEETSGNIYQTSNAGAVWNQVYTGTKCLHSVYFSDTNTGYAVGDSGTILQSTDGGSSWNHQTSPTICNLQSVHFADANTGYAIGDSGIIIKYTAPPSVTQFSQQGGKLIGSGAVGNAYQGVSVSLSSDGNTAIVGGRTDNSYAGAAWIWTRSAGVWTQQGSKLVGSGAVGAADQGTSVSLSSDGNTAIVGGHYDNSDAGAVWIWTRSAGVWTQQGSKLVGSGAVGAAYQGISVSLSSDGNTAIVGGCTDSSNAGAAWIWTRSAGVWTQQGSKLVGSGAVGEAYQGISVSLSSDGNTATVSGYNDNSSAGAAWVWTRSAGVWTQQGSKLVGSGAVGAAYEGASVSLSSDGNTAIVGGYGDNSNVGAAWIWTRSAGVWTQQGSKLVGSGAVGAAYRGYSVSLSSDGNTAIVGGCTDSSNAGAAWIWTRSAGVWTQQGSKLVGSGAVGAAYQGISVSLSSDGNTAIVGGYNDNSTAGAVWIFTTPNAPLPVELRSFSVASEGSDAVLTWTTATEIDNYGFEVQRSVIGDQAPEQFWREVGFVEGSGTSNSPKDYSFSDKSLSARKYSYRLKQFDRDGSFKYSSEVQIEISSAPKVFILSQNYPNPFNPSTTIRYALPSQSKVRLIITNTLGQQVAVLTNGEQETGYHEVQWIPNVASGIYFYRIDAVSVTDPNNRFVQVKRMVLLK